MGKAKEVATEANVHGVHNIESLFAPKGYTKIVRKGDKYIVRKGDKYIVVDGVKPDGNDFWIPLGLVLAFPEVSELFLTVRKFYKNKLTNDIIILKNILCKFAFSLDFIEHKKGDKYIVDGEERIVESDGLHEDWQSLVVGPMNKKTNEMLERALEYDEEAIKFFFTPRETKVFNFEK